MFKNHWWMGTRVESDEGFSVEWKSDSLVYKEDGRSMGVTVDHGADEIIVFTDTVARWDDDPDTLIDTDVRDRIVNNILRALTSYQDRHNGKVALFK
jgi:hypothetical protein